MSPTQSSTSEAASGAWLWPLVGLESAPAEGAVWTNGGHTLVMQDGIARSQSTVSERQAQTQESFGFKWAKRDTFEAEASLDRMREWLVERYGDMTKAKWLGDYGHQPIVLDAGCGAAMSGLELFRPVWDRIRYLGADISRAVDVAKDRIEGAGLSGAFLQADITALPLPHNSVDVIFSEGVLHHTDSTENAIRSLAPLLKPGGRFMFYVYRRKGPVREFTDDYIRERLQPMSPNEAWAALEPLTKLGIALGELNADIEIPEAIDLLDIPAGKINVQRLFYWHVAKAFYRPEYTVDEMNHINYDWYAPKNAHRQSIDEVRAWSAAAGLDIEYERSEDAGITIIAVKR